MDPVSYCPNGKSRSSSGSAVWFSARRPKSLWPGWIGVLRSTETRSRLFEQDSIPDVFGAECRGAILCFADKVSRPLEQGSPSNVLDFGRQGDFFQQSSGGLDTYDKTPVPLGRRRLLSWYQETTCWSWFEEAPWSHPGWTSAAGSWNSSSPGRRSILKSSSSWNLVP